MTVVRVAGIAKTYPGEPPVCALTSVTMSVQAGERVAVTGRSGAGKSTLLNVLGLLDEPTAGNYELLGHDTAVASQSHRDRLRADHLGFVFQDYHILGHRTAYENVELKLAVTGTPRRQRNQIAEEVLTRVGLAHRIHSLGRLLSGGEKQRLAVARAVVNRPTLILADEPTGNLDAENAAGILSLFDEQAARGVAVVVITHDASVAAWADRTLVLDDGRLGHVSDAA